MTFAKLAEYFHTLEGTASRLTMTEALAGLFRDVDGTEIGPICYLLQGRVVPLYEALEFGVADKFMIRAIAGAYSAEEDRVRSAFKSAGDLGKAAQKLCPRGHGSAKLSVLDVYRRLREVAETGGEGSQEKKISLLSGLLGDADALSARYLVRIPLDKLRLGFSDMTILDALSWMISGDKTHRQELEDAYNLRPDIGLLAAEVKKHGLAGLSRIRTTVGVPILAALCQRLPSADDMIRKMDTVAVEPKYDGVRVQIHYQKEKSQKAGSNKQSEAVQSFSRNLENTTGMFPELTKIGAQLDADSVILDSEAVGTDPKTGKLIPFQQTVTRKRKHGVAEASASVPLRFYVFDILYKDGKSLLPQPLEKRRIILEKTVTAGRVLTVSPQIVTGDADRVRSYHDEQLKKGLEGAVVKKWSSPYEPGRRGYSWVKFKEEEGHTGKLTDTVDCVVMGFYAGEGKRAGFGIGAFLVGVRDGDGFRSITKIGTGVTDEQWKELKRRFSKLAVEKRPKEYVQVGKTLVPDTWLTPKTVVEVAGDDLTKSPTHAAGYAIRFPRLVRVRTDKGPPDATTVGEVARMYQNQGNGVGKRQSKK